MTGCVCKEPGWCERHQCLKHARWHELCQTHQGYFDAWEAGAGPGQHTGDGLHSESSARACGPGCHLSRLLAKFWIKDKKGCGCKQHAAVMDQWGPEVCKERMDTILGWIEKEAKDRHLPFVRKAAEILVRMAIRNAIREAEKLEQMRLAV